MAKTDQEDLLKSAQSIFDGMFVALIALTFPIRILFTFTYAKLTKKNYKIIS
jgi:hypothetical protein